MGIRVLSLVFIKDLCYFGIKVSSLLSFYIFIFLILFWLIL